MPFQKFCSEMSKMGNCTKLFRKNKQAGSILSLLRTSLKFRAQFGLKLAYNSWFSLKPKFLNLLKKFVGMTLTVE